MKDTYIFNQYYIDLLKRIKEWAKGKKEEDSNAKNIYKSIKENYLTLDKNSDEYINYIKEQITEESWDKYLENNVDWLKDNVELSFYKNIKLADIISILDDEYLCNHFISVFYIFHNNMSDEEAENIVKILQTIDSKDLIETITNANIKKILLRLFELRNIKIKDKSGIDMQMLEDTTVGKLAKEILEDIDVSKLQKSIGESGDVFKALGDPDSGFADIITNVSRKMANKISSGEFKQENLVQDAMKFASIMPSLFGGSGGTGNTGKSKGPDMSDLMGMMSSMMSGGKDNNFKNMMKNMSKSKSSNGSKYAFNEQAYKKIAKAKKLKKKLSDKKSSKNSDDVTEAYETSEHEHQQSDEI